MGGLDHPYQPERMTDGGFWPGRTPSVERKTMIFGRQCRREEDQSGHTFPPQRPCNSTWTRVGGRHQGVNLDFQRRVMNCESSRNLPTGKCDVISGKSVACGRPAWRKGFSSPGVMKPGTSGLESVLPAQRNVLNERGRLQSEGTQEGASIPLLFSTGKVFVLHLGTFPVFPTNKKNEPQFVLQTQKCWLYSDTLFE